MNPPKGVLTLLTMALWFLRIQCIFFPSLLEHRIETFHISSRLCVKVVKCVRIQGCEMRDILQLIHCENPGRYTFNAT